MRETDEIKKKLLSNFTLLLSKCLDAIFFIKCIRNYYSKSTKASSLHLPFFRISILEGNISYNSSASLDRLLFHQQVEPLTTSESKVRTLGLKYIAYSYGIQHKLGR